MLPISKATMSESIGKVIICTNIFPTKTVLDELINASSNDLNTNFNITLYKENYVHYDKVGISQDNDKTTLINSCISNLNFYYTEPNASHQNNNQDKAGMYNPSFQDCAQYGIQSTLMYVFLPDDNLNKWVSFFKNRNNSYPVLKDQSLRFVNIAQPVINQQNPVIGLQTPQKYCVVPGLISTQKSNLSTGETNSTC
jgi:putative hemolysin